MPRPAGLEQARRLRVDFHEPGKRRRREYDGLIDMSQTALVIGGTGPTGPHIVNGLIDRGYETSILHRGTHDSDLIPAHVGRIIGDPHFKETLSEALGDRRFDLIVATYGRSAMSQRSWRNTRIV